MNTNYFCVTEAEGDGRNIGIVLANTDVEFREKLKRCISEHFDEDSEIPDTTTLDDVKFGKELLLDVRFVDSQFQAEGTQVHICETWLY